MEYITAFLAGVIAFISPCLLPMLPVYVLYFTGSKTQHKNYTALKNSLGFVLGFSLLFVLLGAFAGTIGSVLKQHQTTVNIISGIVVILFGLNFMGLFKIKLFSGKGTKSKKTKDLGFFSSILFGIVFGISWTPCVGATLGSILMLASQQGSVIKGVILLTFYSLGLGILFILSALLIEQLKTTIQFIKRHYTVINVISGLLLIVVGVFMITGQFGRILSFLTF